MRNRFEIVTNLEEVTGLPDPETFKRMLVAASDDPKLSALIKKAADEIRSKEYGISFGCEGDALIPEENAALTYAETQHIYQAGYNTALARSGDKIRRTYLGCGLLLYASVIVSLIINTGSKIDQEPKPKDKIENSGSNFRDRVEKDKSNYFQK